MNREILFRGKLVANGEWSYGNLVVKRGGVEIITPDDTPIGKYGVVDSSTVGQYTGLTDKNGRKIFEGDLIRNSAGEVGRVSWYPEHFAFMIYRLHPPAVFHMEVSDGPEIEVISNIFENPEPLEEN